MSSAFLYACQNSVRFNNYTGKLEGGQWDTGCFAVQVWPLCTMVIMVMFPFIISPFILIFILLAPQYMFENIEGGLQEICACASWRKIFSKIAE